MKAIEMLIRYWAIKNYKPSNETFSIRLTKSCFERIEVFNNALTFYHGKENEDSSTIQTFFNDAHLHECNKQKIPLYFGHRNNQWHSVWHSNKKSFDDTHHRVFKQNFSDISSEDLQCILLQIRAYQKQNQLCSNKKPCLLSKNDFNHLVSRYNKHHQKMLNQVTQSIYEHVRQIYRQSMTAFINAFVNTFIQRYIKPMLLNRCWDKHLVEATCGSLQLGLNCLTGKSIANAMIATFASKASEYLLKKVGMNATVASNMAIFLNSILNNITEPEKLLKWLANSLGVVEGMGIAYLFGERLAHTFIRTLPKLKVEPLPNQRTDRSTGVVQLGGLRRVNRHNL